MAFVISNGQNNKWRYWRVDPSEEEIANWSGPAWTDDIEKACHFARREDAETWAHDDEDAWFIRERILPSEACAALVLFRAFIDLNVTQWAMGAGDHHHPIWELVESAIGKIAHPSSARWQFIQPTNRKKLADIENG